MAEHLPHTETKNTVKHKRANETEALGEEELKERPLANEDGENNAPRSRKGKKKTKRFPLGGLIFMFFLIAVILAAAYFGLEYMDRYQALKEEYDSVLQAAEAERSEAGLIYAEADPESEANTAERQKVTEKMIAEAEAELEALRRENEETDAAIREAEETISELQGIEGYDYYRAIYDEYVEGRAYVEDLLSGD